MKTRITFDLGQIDRLAIGEHLQPGARYAASVPEARKWIMSSFTGKLNEAIELFEHVDRQRENAA